MEVSPESVQNFAIVHFYNEKTRDNKEVTELIPRLWLRKDRKRDEWSCWWPPVEHQTLITKWVKDERPPEDDWMFCNDFKILAWADTYETGLRRLERSFFRSRDIVTDSDNDVKHSIVSRMSRNRARNILFENSDEQPSDLSDGERVMTKKKALGKRKAYSNQIGEKAGSLDKGTSKESRNDGPTFPGTSASLENDCVSSQRVERALPRIQSNIVFNSTQILTEIQNQRGSRLSPSPRSASMSSGLNKELMTTPTSHFSRPRSNMPPLSKNIANRSHVLEKARQVDELRKKITDPELSAFVDYFDAKLELGLSELGNQLNNTRRSLRYDLSQKVEELKVTMATEVPSEGFSMWEEVFGSSLPIESVEEFEAFDKSLDLLDQEDDEKKFQAKKRQEFLRRKFQDQIAPINEFSKGVNAIIGGIMHRNVQLQYSGVGRQTSNDPVKRAFNKTNCFKCIEDVLLKKFPTPSISVLTASSNYFTGAKDRKG